MSDYILTKDSYFLDIGSGFGKPVFHAAMQTCNEYALMIQTALVLVQRLFLQEYAFVKTLNIK